MSTFNELHRDKWMIGELLKNGRIRDRVVKWGLRLELGRINKEIEKLAAEYLVIR